VLFRFQFLGLLRIEQFSSELKSACAIATLKYGLKISRQFFQLMRGETKRRALYTLFFQRYGEKT